MDSLSIEIISKQNTWNAIAAGQVRAQNASNLPDIKMQRKGSELAIEANRERLQVCLGSAMNLR